MKSTTLFGGVQVFGIIISIIRSKFVAVYLGPTGMGISGLLNSTTSLVSTLTNFGLGSSAVRDVASANETGDYKKIIRVITILKKLVWFTGFFGLLITLLLSDTLSNLTFGNSNYTNGFCVLALSILLSQLTNGNNVLLQGFQKLKLLAKSNIIASFFSLLISVPLYYFFGLKGIVPSIIVSSFLLYFITWWYVKKLNLKTEKISLVDTLNEGKGMLKMGFLLSLSSLFGVGTSYILRIYISSNGGVNDVGLYNAGFAIIGTYVGMVFTAMGTDYYPKLSSINKDNFKCTNLINQQAEMVILILAPILTIFIIFINWVVILLYSGEFVRINGMIQWAALGMYFKAASFSIGYIFMAKGESKIFIWSEFFANAYLLLFNILGYYYYGLTGLGFSFAFFYLIYLIQIYFTAQYKYNFSFTNEFYKIFSIQLFLGFTCFVLTNLFDTPLSYFIGLPLVLISSLYSLSKLNNLLDLKSIILNFRK